MSIVIIWSKIAFTWQTRLIITIIVLMALLILGHINGYLLMLTIPIEGILGIVDDDLVCRAVLSESGQLPFGNAGLLEQIRFQGRLY